MREVTRRDFWEREVEIRCLWLSSGPWPCYWAHSWSRLWAFHRQVMVCSPFGLLVLLCLSRDQGAQGLHTGFQCSYVLLYVLFHWHFKTTLCYKSHKAKKKNLRSKSYSIHGSKSKEWEEWEKILNKIIFTFAFL